MGALILTGIVSFVVGELVGIFAIALCVVCKEEENK